jgi:two-component system OmpR family sensor kinase
VQYSLKRRFVITAIILFLLVSLASTALLYTAQQYNFYIERSVRVQQVYASYRSVSDHTYRKLSALGQIVEENTLNNLNARYRNKEALRAALSNVRQSIVGKLAHMGDVADAAELEHFNKIERLAEEIISGSKLVREAIEKSQLEAAVVALTKLRSFEVEGSFIRLIDDAIDEELKKVRETQLVVQDLNTLLTRLLGIIFFCFVFFGAALLFTTWRALTHRLQIFESATGAYQAGDFSARVDNNVKDEFSGLAVALNNMAAEVETQRQREKNTQENLEAIITSRTQELRTSNEKLEMISETRKQFLADISHELRTPLTIIQGEVDLALREPATTPEQFRTAFRRVKEQVLHTARFVQDLLFVARAEDGKAPIHKCAMSIVPLIVDICEDFAVIAAQKNINISNRYPESEIVVNVDASKIRQVFTILLDNAVRYSYQDSTIEVNIRALKTALIVEIKDAGIGLKYNETSQVFSRFYRGSEGSGKASGTGLGLPVAKSIVEAHGGTITLEGETGEGSTATVTLPLVVNNEVSQ